MANQDVQIKDVDAIRVYKQQFGDFYQSFSEHIHQLNNALHRKLEELQQIKTQLKREREALDEQIREAHQRSQNAYNVGSYRTYYRQDGSTHIEFEPDHNYIMQCRAEYEHLSGPVYYNMQNCAELIHNKLMRATVAVNLIEQKTNATNNTLQTYVENGKKFLDLAAQYIEQYKEQTPNK